MFFYSVTIPVDDLGSVGVFDVIDGLVSQQILASTIGHFCNVQVFDSNGEVVGWMEAWQDNATSGATTRKGWIHFLKTLKPDRDEG